MGERQTILRAILRNKSITQKVLAECIKMPEHTLSKKMTGKAEFTWNEVKAICQRLGIDNPLKVFK